MTELVKAYVATIQARSAMRAANQALKLSQTLPDGSVEKDYAQSLAAQECKKALRISAQSHIGRIAEAVGVSRA